MSDDGFLECGIPVEDYADQNITLYVHLKDETIITISHLAGDPSFYRGWLCIEHDLFGTRTSSLVRESDFKYLSYHVKPKAGER